MDIIYRAFDGTEFNDKDECKLYEKNLEVKVSQNIDSSIPANKSHNYLG